MGVYNEIKSGIEQAIAYEKGTLKAQRDTLSIAPVAEFSPGEIKEIRNNTGLTQVLFAKYMGGL
jgi:transcriptional regulator, XRE family